MTGFCKAGETAAMSTRAAIISLAIISLAMFGGTAATAQSSPVQEAPPRVEVLQQLYDCRAIADPAQRLACYDARVGALQTAESARDIRVVDREQVRQTRRGLFGLSLPNIGNIFGDGNDDATAAAADSDGVNEIAATLSAIGNNGLGRWVYTLDNGQVWLQTDTSAPGRAPRAGQSVVIRRAALGSFMISVEGRSGVRVRRER